MKKQKLKFKYSSPSNDRIKNNGIWFQVWSDEHWSFMEKTKRWELDDSEAFEAARSGGYSNCEEGKSFRKFKRRLRKQPELIGKLIYCTRYHNPKGGYDYNIFSVLD